MILVEIFEEIICGYNYDDVRVKKLIKKVEDKFLTYLDKIIETF